MVNKPQDFLTLTGAARRARSEGHGAKVMI